MLAKISVLQPEKIGNNWKIFVISDNKLEYIDSGCFNCNHLEIRIF